MVSALGALFALILAAGPIREFFDLELLSAGQWFLSLAAVAAGLVTASALWRLPFIQHLEAEENGGEELEATTPAGDALPEPTHGRHRAGLPRHPEGG